MNAYETAQALGITGTDSEIVAALKAWPRHVKNVYITGGPADTESVNLLHLLTARHRVMGMGPAQQWTGPLIDLEASNQQVASIMSLLRPMLQVNDTLVYCKDSDDAAKMLNALAGIVAGITGKSEQVAAEVALLSGGRVTAEYTDLTVEEFASQRMESINVAASESARIAKQGYLAEANDTVIHAIDGHPAITQADVLAAFTARLAEVWV